MGWITEHAPDPVDLNSCIQCGLCLPACPTFRLTGRETASPRGRLTAMSAVDQGFEVDEGFAEVMGSCLQCRACEVVCPAFVPFGKVMEGARAEVMAQVRVRGRGGRRLGVTRGLRSRRLLGWSARLVWVVQKLRLWRLAPARLRMSLRGLRPQSARRRSIIGRAAPTGTGAPVAVILAGCVMDAWFAPVHEATIAVLERAGYEVAVPPDQTCCGALAAHDGWAAEARQMAERNVAALAGADVLVVNAAGCGAHLKEYGQWAEGGDALASTVKDVTEVVALAVADGRLPAMTGAGSVAVQDPCHLRHAQRIFDEPRAVVEAAGYEVVEIDETGRCCGAAGLYSLLEPQMSGELGRAKADQVMASATTVVASANPGCEMQLRAHLPDHIRVAHPIELYAEALRRSDR